MKLENFKLYEMIMLMGESEDLITRSGLDDMIPTLEHICAGKPITELDEPLIAAGMLAALWVTARAMVELLEMPGDPYYQE